MSLLESSPNNKCASLNKEGFVSMIAIRNSKIHIRLLTDILDPNCLTLTPAQPWKSSPSNKFMKTNSPSKKNKSIFCNINLTTAISSWMPKDTECTLSTNWKWKNCWLNSEMPELKSFILKAKSP